MVNLHPSRPLTRHPSSTPLGNFISRSRPWPVVLCTSLALLALPAVALTLDGVWAEAAMSGFVRPLFLPPAVVAYVLIVSPIVERYNIEVLQRFRPIALVSDEEFESVVATASRASLRGELTAVLLTLLFTLPLSQPWRLSEDINWTTAYWIVASSAMYAIIGLLIYSTITVTRLTNALHRLPLRLDLFDQRALESVGRQSFLLSLAFLGGMLGSMLLGLNASNILAWQTWVFYLPMAGLSIAIFFLNMRGTHRLLLAEKRRLLEIANAQLHQKVDAIRHALESGLSLGELAGEFNALTAYESRLRQVRTWPYNTRLLRALFVSILVPVLSRLLGYIFTPLADFLP